MEPIKPIEEISAQDAIVEKNIGESKSPEVIPAPEKISLPREINYSTSEKSINNVEEAVPSITVSDSNLLPKYAENYPSEKKDRIKRILQLAIDKGADVAINEVDSEMADEMDAVRDGLAMLKEKGIIK